MLGASASVAALVSMSLKLFERPVYSHAPSFAAYGIHIGVALIALGIAFSGPYKIESEPTMAMGETVKVGQFEVTFKNLYEGEGAGYIFLEGELEVRKDGKLIGIAAPQRRVYAKWGQMQFAEAAVIPSLGNEFYATLMAVDQQNRAVFRLSSNPLVNWLWIGGILMCLLPFVSFQAPQRPGKLMLLKLAGIGKLFGARAVLRNISFEVHPGTVTLLVGANGAGKTTLLKIMAGLARPTVGTVERFCEDGGLGYLGHATFIYPGLTALENLAFWSGMHGNPTDKATLSEALARVELAPFAEERAGTFRAVWRSG